MMSRACAKKKNTKGVKRFMRKIGNYVWAFLAALVLALVVGLTTLGSTVSTGKSMTYFTDKTVAYQVVGGSKTVESVYVNIGAVYTDAGNSTKVEIQYSNTDGSTTGTAFGSATMYNLSEGKTRSLNYNWQAVVSGGNTSVQYLYFKANRPLELCEIAAFDIDGNRIELKPYSVSAFSAEECAKTLDKQTRLTKDVVSSQTFRNTCNLEEGRVLTAINTLKVSQYEGFTYHLDNNFGVLATAFSAGAVGLFGTSTFALRLPSLLAAVASIVFLFLLCKELFKSEKYAFFASVFFLLGGIVTNVARLGSGYAMVASALLASTYFAYRFFAKGISKAHPLRDGMNVLVSGIFSAIAIALETTAFVPVLGILVLVGFGVNRVFKAERVAKIKLGANAENDAELQAITNEYSYKKRVSIGFGVLSFVVGACLLSLFVGAFFYKPLVLAYDNGAEPTKSFLDLIIANALNSARAADAVAASKASIFAWLWPFGSTAIYTMQGAGERLTWSVSLNIGLSLLALVAVAFTTVCVALGFVQKTKSKTDLRIRRAYFIFLTAVGTAMIAASVKGAPTLLCATLFSGAMMAFIPLAFMALSNLFPKQARVWNIALCAVLVIGVAFFVIGLPAIATKTAISSGGSGDGWTGNY